MSSLLDGIDVKDPSTQKPKSSGPNPKVIKGAVAGVLFVVAGVFIGMQTGLIPSPFGGPVRNSQGQVVTPTAAPQQTEAERQKLAEDQQKFIEDGGSIGDS